MKRRDFIARGCSSCLSIVVMSNLMSSCIATRYVSGKLNENGLAISKNDFTEKKTGAYRSFIIVRNEALQFPICIYRFNDQEYTALWMECTHQGSELTVSGDYLQCPAHGSEFNNKGSVKSGPADRNLRTFPVTVTNNEIMVDLRKQS